MGHSWRFLIGVVLIGGMLMFSAPLLGSIFQILATYAEISKELGDVVAQSLDLLLYAVKGFLDQCQQGHGFCLFVEIFGGGFASLSLLFKLTEWAERIGSWFRGRTARIRPAPDCILRRVARLRSAQTLQPEDTAYTELNSEVCRDVETALVKAKNKYKEKFNKDMPSDMSNALSASLETLKTQKIVNDIVRDSSSEETKKQATSLQIEQNSKVSKARDKVLETGKNDEERKFLEEIVGE